MLPEGKISTVEERPVIRETGEEESNLLAIWKTLTWREVFDMLIGILIIAYLSISFILVFGV